MVKEQQKTFHHRASLKQKNKPFKSRHATKGSLKDKAKGRTQRAAVKGKVLRKHSRADRRNAIRTEQRKKREQILMSTRIFTGRHRAPKIVAVIPLCTDTDTADIVRSLYKSVDEEYPDKRNSMLNIARFKQTLQFVEVGRNLLDILDVTKVADYTIMGLSAEVEVDAFGEQCLSAIQNQGHSNVFTVVQGLDGIVAKRRNDVRKSLHSFVAHFFPDADKVYTTDPTESLTVLRMLTAQVPRGVKWRDTRPYLLADNVEFEPSAEDPQTGRLAISGYLRGANLSANRLVHIPSFGDFQIEQIFHVPVAMEAAKGNTIEEDDDAVALDKPDPEHQDSLVDANEPDQLGNEQTWPDDEEMDGWRARMEEMEEEERLGSERVLRVPKGTSTYQAAWIADNAEEGSDSDSDSDDDEMMDASDEEAASGSEDDEIEYKDMRIGSDGKPIDDSDEGSDEEAGTGAEDENALGPEEEEAQLQAYLKERQELDNDDAHFPDEVDTPMDQAARQRFARFRGLQSFRTSPWDPYENLPLDYGRIFQFESFKRTQQRVVRATAKAPAKAGMHVRIVLRAVPAQVVGTFRPDRPFVAFGLHQYEHQMSVLHFTVMRSAEYTEPVRSKDPLVMHFGFRRYNVRPLFSQHQIKANNVHKFERFLKHGEVSIGTVFAPIQFGASPVSLYSPDMTLVGTGTSFEVNPTRILAKRVILTGAPFKIHKRGAVIRYMFFTADDVNWFKPVQIYTKRGRVGHISESLGTHGYMKCIFDGPLKQMDTVCMNLYKRVFPKWNTSLWAEHEQGDEEQRQWTGPVADPAAMEM
ncbi:ribosome biogenesis protein tsr1 [Coemansia sp. RSA 552]|nr:ribosome biogenesis protein tsr1 [Coemansia sp. RSA 552]